MKIRIKNIPNNICHQMLGYETEAKPHPKHKNFYRFYIKHVKTKKMDGTEIVLEPWIVSKEACEVISDD